jgi:hypothetical protein
MYKYDLALPYHLDPPPPPHHGPAGGGIAYGLVRGIVRLII